MLKVRRPLVYCPLVWLVAAAANPFPLRAQYQKYEGQPIRTIHFEPDDQPLEASELHEILPLRMNQPLRMADVRASIERLFATGRYADIQVEAQPYRDGVAIIFKTQNSWFVGAVSAGGDISSPPNPGQLENAANLSLGQPYTEAHLEQGMANQRRLLESNGLYRSTVSPLFDWESDRAYEQVNIRFLVNSGPRARYTTPVLSGDLKMDAARIRNATGFRRWIIRTWKPVTEARTRHALEGIRGLYLKENRLEAKVTLESMAYDREANRAIPNLRIDAGPRIEVNTVGASFSRKQLQRYVPIFEERAVDHDLLVEGARNLRDHLQSQGYFEAEVEFKEQRVTNDRASIDFLINTGERHRLVQIGIEGNRYFSTDAIRERMYLQTASFLQFRHGRYSEALLRRDEDAITDLYRSNGFRDVKVSHRTQDDYQGKSGEIAVFIRIDEGPQYFIERLELSGLEKMNKEDLLSRLSSVDGQPYSDYNIAVDRDTILARYFEGGFPNATFEWSSEPANRRHRVVLRYVIREGPAQFVRQVVVTGNRVTRNRLINRNLTLNPGDPLSPVAMNETERRLYDLGVFSHVNAAIQDPDGETDHKYVLYSLEEASRFSVATGLGAEFGRIGGCSNCLEAPGGATGVSPRISVDVARGNLWGLTHSISLRTRASTLDQRALLNYTWPRFFTRENLTVSFTALLEHSRDIRTFTFRRQEVSAQLTQKYSKDITIFYRYSYRRVGVTDLKISPFLLPQLTQPVRVGIASLNVVQDRRDDPLDPHKGIYNTLDLGLAARGAGSQVSFLRLLARNATYHGIGRKMVLARSTQLGILHAFRSQVNQLEAIPLAEHFFGGGGDSQRGFAEWQAGPRDTSTGFPLGGTALFFNQAELRFPLIGDNMGGVLFHDMGNVFSSIGNMSFRVRQRSIQDFDYTVHAVGIGIRYRLPVGPFRLDLGYSVNPPAYYGVPSNYTQQDLINLGPNPCPPPPAASVCRMQRLNRFQPFFSIGQTF
jgi:outer membrane protein insertion porin family